MLVRKLMYDQSGGTALEYGLIAALLSAVILIAVV